MLGHAGRVFGGTKPQERADMGQRGATLGRAEGTDDPGRSWETLDDKIRAAITDICQGKIGKSLLRVSEDQRKGTKRLIRGRQLLRLAYQWYQTNEDLHQLYCITDLAKVELVNDDLESFENDWLKYLNNQMDFLYTKF